MTLKLKNEQEEKQALEKKKTSLDSELKTLSEKLAESDKKLNEVKKQLTEKDTEFSNVSKNYKTESESKALIEKQKLELSAQIEQLELENCHHTMGFPAELVIMTFPSSFCSSVVSLIRSEARFLSLVSACRSNTPDSSLTLL